MEVPESEGEFRSEKGSQGGCGGVDDDETRGGDKGGGRVECRGFRLKIRLKNFIVNMQ